MALTTQEQAQLRALIQREGGLAAFSDEVKDLYIADRQAAALTALSGAISVTVTDWATLTAQVQQIENVTLYSVIGAISSAVAARDDSKLGPLSAVLYASVKKHFGL